MRASLSVALDPSHTRRRSVGFRKARQRRYKILLLRPPCGVCLVRQLVPSVIASRQKNATRGIELILFFDAWRLVLTNHCKSRCKQLQPQIEALQMADLHKDDTLKLIRLQTVLLLLLWASSLLSNAATPVSRLPVLRELTFTWWGCWCLCPLHKPAESDHPFSFSFCVCFYRYGPFNCILVHKLSRRLFTFSLCSSGLMSATLALSTIYLFIKVSFSLDTQLVS